MSKLPQCPRCGERDKVKRYDNPYPPYGPAGYWCNRCCGWLSQLTPLPGKHTPDDIGPPIKRKRYRKGSTPRLTGEAQERGTPLKGKKGRSVATDGCPKTVTETPAGDSKDR